MRKDKRFVFLHSIKQFEEYNLIKGRDVSEIPIQIIAFELELRLFLQNKNIKYKIPEEYISEKEAEEIDETAFSLGENWHKDLFIFRDISLGQLIQLDFKLYFDRIIRNLHTILNFIEIENPTEIIAFAEKEIFIQEFNEILQRICLLKGISLNLIPIKKITEITNKLKRFRKNIILKTIIRYLTYLKIRLDFFSSLIDDIKRRKSKTILIIHPYYCKSLVDEASKDYKVILYNDFKSYPLIKQNLINSLKGKKTGLYKFFESYKSYNIKKHSEIFIKNSLNKWKSIIKSPTFKKIFVYNEISIWPFVKKKIYKTIFMDFKRIIENILAISKFLIKEKVKLIIFNDEVLEIPIIFSLLALKLKIHTLGIQHGVTGGVYGYFPSYSKKYAVWGRSSQEWLKKYGMPIYKMILTGPPNLDRHININRSEKIKAMIKKSVYKDFNIKYDKNLIVFTTTHVNLKTRLTNAYENPFEVEKSFKCILNAVKNNPNLYLVIKLHPYDHHQQIPKVMIEQLGVQNVSVVMNYDIVHLLTASDCVITLTSTTGLEGLLFNKPLIILRFRENDYIFSYVKFKVALEVINCNNLPSIIQNCLINPDSLKENRDKFLEEYIFKRDGLSTKRVLQIINDTLKN